MQLTNCRDLVLAGGVAANIQLRMALQTAAKKLQLNVFYPPLELCTDNGVMIAFAGAMRLLSKVSSETQTERSGAFSVKPRWDLAPH